MRSSRLRRWWLLVATLWAIGTAFRLAVYVENGYALHDVGPALVGLAATTAWAVLALRWKRNESSE
jgi:hypothetical protein